MTSATTLDNPAGRLLRLLTAFSEGQSNDRIDARWASVLGVERADVAMHLGPIAGLVPDLHRAVEGKPGQLSQVELHSAEWLKPIIPPSTPLNGKLSSVLPKPPAMAALAGVAEYLHDLAPEGRVPSQSQITDQRDRLSDLIDSMLEEDDDLPQDLQQEIVGRLHDIALALDHLAVGGPRAVRRASEALFGVAAISDPESRKKQRVRAALSLAGALWFMFTLPGEARQALEGWSEMTEDPLAPELVAEVKRCAPELAPTRLALEAENAPRGEDEGR